MSIVCSKQQPNQQSADFPITSAYESTDSSSTPDAVYTPVQKPDHDYESANAELDYEKMTMF